MSALHCLGVDSRSIRGEAHLDLEQVGAGLGMDIRWILREQKLRLESQWTELEFARDSRAFSLNGVKVFLGRPVAGLGGKLWIAERDYELTLQPLLTPQKFSPVPSLYRLVIDAGHGGKDPGAMNASLNLQEKHLALDLARRLAAVMRDRGFEVLFTRSEDTYLTLAERSTLANQVEADLFVSLHFNAAGSSAVEGVETYAFTPQHQPSTARESLVAADRQASPANRQDPWNMMAAFYVQRELSSDLETTDRGVRRARFGVLRGLECPGILVEGGFVSGSREGRNIGSAAYRQKMAVAIAEGILAYRNTLDRLRGNS